MRLVTSILAVGISLAFAACGSGGSPSVKTVQPAAVPPGGLVIVSGQHLDRVAAVSLGGRLLPTMTVVNNEVLTVLAPSDLAPGIQPLELKALDGRRTVTTLTIGATPTAGGAPPAPPQSPAPAPAPMPAPPAAVAPPARVTPPPPPQVARPAQERDDDKQEDKDKKEEKDKKDEPPDRGRGR